MADFPACNSNLIDKGLEERMALAQQITSMILSLRRKANIKVRQPLLNALILTANKSVREGIVSMSEIIELETNVKSLKLEHMDKASGSINKIAKANFKTLGAKCGKKMKEVAAVISELSFQDILTLETQGNLALQLSDMVLELTLQDVEILTEDLNSNLSITEKGITVVIDTNIPEELRREGIARELVNRIQNIRKDSDFDVTDKITITFAPNTAIEAAVNDFKDYIASQTLATEIKWDVPVKPFVIELDDDVNIEIGVEKISKKSFDIRWEQRFSSYKNALAKLTEVVDSRSKNSLSALEQEGLIQRFEYTYELSWKVLQDLLKYKGYDIAGPNPVLQQALKDGYITDERGWRTMKKARETTSHTYNEADADEIVKDIYKAYILLFKHLTIRLVEEIDGKQQQLF